MFEGSMLVLGCGLSLWWESRATLLGESRGRATYRDAMVERLASGLVCMCVCVVDVCGKTTDGHKGVLSVLVNELGVKVGQVGT